MKPFVRILVIPALILLVGMACGISIGDVDTDEPAEVATVEIAAPVEEEVVEEEGVEEALPYFAEEFDEGTADWSYFIQNGKDEDVSFGVSDSRLGVNISNEETYIYFVYDAYTDDNIWISTLVENRVLTARPSR